MLDTLNRHVVQPLVAMRRRSRHLEFLRHLERTQFDPPEVVKARQLRMLRRTLQHAFDTVPYYHRTWAAAGVHPADIGSLDDLRHFPVVSKADIRERGTEMVSRAYNPAKLRVKRTSGSTGVPLTIRLDERGAQWKYACTLRADEWSGWRRGQRVAKVWGNPEYRHFGLRGRVTNHLVDRAVYLDTCHLTEARISEFVAEVRRHRPGLIFGHAHSLYLLACQLKKSGVRDIRPNGIISTAMPLYDWQRTVIEDVFGAPATNRYGCEEVSLIACECEQHRGMHVAAESVYTEVLPATAPASKDADGSVAGKLVVTDLSNFAMPLIRYQIGDVVTASTRPCACGRGLPLLERVEGRDADYVVTPSGGLVSGISLTENFALLITGAAQVQIVQETVTYLRIRMVKDQTFSDTSLKQIEKLVRDTFGPAMRYDMEFVDLIPQEPSGKYRFCISKVLADHLTALSI
ncbi:phenylacetate--CoA ligase family protein [Fimbriiglobus ruber]|uniref:Coenzyme F390 synthetase n=1 Tax=Fimbriiglobus ruber TaxID=1908690 RepID=A0A225DZM8_9BACT|nr:phenylacetate--CoA ligase family protein [Fimbriiglobus ruber]OWK43216.1 Coenzyme F390 synthetase [Fimbriiglobus ruber]